MTATRQSTQEIIDWLVTETAKLLGVPKGQIEIDEPLVNYLTDSRDALSLAADLQDWLGVEMSASLIWDHPTIKALAQYVVQEVFPQK